MAGRPVITHELVARMESAHAEMLKSIRDDLDAGRLEQAREKLMAVPLMGEPADDELRLIGAMYSGAGMAEMAGRCWYFEAHPTEEMTTAIRRFEKSCGMSPFLIREALEAFPGISDANLASAERLESEEAQLNERYFAALSFDAEQSDVRTKRSWLGCVPPLMTFSLIVLIFILGIVQLVRILAGLFD